MTAPHVSSKSHKLDERFTEDVHKELRAEDSEAWHGVVAILLLIVTVGLILAVITLSATG